MRNAELSRLNTMPFRPLSSDLHVAVGNALDHHLQLLHKGPVAPPHPAPVRLSHARPSLWPLPPRGGGGGGVCPHGRREAKPA